jgi:hypothetical protein
MKFTSIKSVNFTDNADHTAIQLRKYVEDSPPNISNTLQLRKIGEQLLIDF